MQNKYFSLTIPSKMFAVILILYVASVNCAEGPTITLPEGKIEGLTATSALLKKEFYAYLGIPFAAPPVGELRMKPPQPVQPWNETFKATSNRIVCYQIKPKVQYPQDEDCLTINVFTPVKPGESEELPVMVSIYGGGFTHGYASVGTSGHDYFVEADIVVVTFNYRVGPFGFLSTGDEVIRGNMGVKDQLFALKWVQRNIHLFGGDPNKVTIQGQSAGSASVTYHVLSPASQGLFRAAIGNSGSAINNWANINGSALHIARGVARILDNSLSNEASSQEIYDVVMKADAEAINDTGSVYVEYAPVVEAEHEGAFITESMYELVKSGRFSKVPLLIGFNSEEDISLAGNAASLLALGKKYDDNTATLVPADMNANSSLTANIGWTIKNFYTGGVDFVDDLGAAIRVRSDDSFVRGVIRYAELQANYSDVYLYQFSYHGILGRNNLTCEGCGRVAHGEDGYYLFAGDLTGIPESDVQTVKRYTGFFINFIKHLNPTPQKEELFQNLTWPILNPKALNYLDIDENLTIKTNPRNGTYKKWVAVYDKYAHEPLLSY